MRIKKNQQTQSHMKRFARIVGVLLLLIISAIWAIYTIRKHKIDKQYVSSAGTSVLSIAVDDLLLEHISSLLPKRRKLSDTVERNSWMKQIVFNAGIDVPARIHVFTMPAKEAQFYGILALRNYDDCFSFFANHFPEDINFIDKERSLVSVTVDKYVKVLFDRSHIVYKFSLPHESDFMDLQSILSSPEGWSQIGSLKEFKHAGSSKHISYALKDGSLKLEATVKKYNTEIHGEWLLSQDLGKEFRIRDMDTTKQVLAFWNVLPLSEVAPLGAMMHKFMGLEPELVNSADYFDLQIKDDTVMQQDTSIVYAYDDDFNAIEESQVNEAVVPSITHSWGYNEGLAEELPTTLFYKFRKKRVGEYLLNTTLDSLPDHVSSKQTRQPLYLYIDFERWPVGWEMPIFRILKDEKVKASIATTQKNSGSLLIKGEITYSK